MQRPLLPLLIAVTAGISSGYVFEIPRFWLTACLILALIAALVSGWKDLRYLLMPIAMIVMFVLSIMNINLYLYEKPDPAHIMHHAGPEPLTVEGLISAPPQFLPDKTRLIISSQRLYINDTVLPIRGKILLNCVTGDKFRYGQILRFKTKLKIPHNFQNPGGFDYERHLRFKGILVHGFINNPAAIIIMRENQGHPLRMQIEAFRSHLKAVIRANAASPAAEIVQAMILGDQQEIPKALMDQFNRTGTSHIIAISGFNIGIIAFFAIFLVRMIMKTSEYLLLKFNINKVSMALSFIPVAIFTFIAGMGISVVRATIMAMAFLVAILLGKERDLYNTLILAALLILIVSPHSLFDISFQLSFSAVAAILFMTPKLTALVPRPPLDGRPKFELFIFRRLYDIALFTIASVSATLGTLPLVIFYFNRMSLITLPANLAVVPIMGIIALPVCMAIILAAPLSEILTIWLIKLSAFLMDISVSMVDYFASLPWAAYTVVTPNIFEIVVYYMLLFVIFRLLANWTKKKGEAASSVETPSRLGGLLKWGLAGLVFLLISSLLLGHLAESQNRNLRITAIDVGQGSSTLVRFPGGKKMLIDGGGSFDDDFDIGRHVAAPYLWHEKIRRIDIVVLTHVHPDHLNGLKFILENFNVGEVWTSGHVSSIDSFKEFERIIIDKKIPCHSVSTKSLPVYINGVHLQILNPTIPAGKSDGSETYNDINNLSVVTKLTYGAVRILLPADISEPTEKRLARQGIKIQSDVLFVPHHGGLTSSTEPFLDIVRPRVAVVSCGKDNVFGLPHAGVLDRYHARNIPILRTDRDGAVTFATDGHNLFVHSIRESRTRVIMGSTSRDGG